MREKTLAKKREVVPDLYLSIRIPRLDDANLDALARHLHMAITLDSPESASEKSASAGSEIAAAPAREGGDDLAWYGEPLKDLEQGATLELEMEPKKLMFLLRAARAWEKLSTKPVVKGGAFFEDETLSGKKNSSAF